MTKARFVIKDLTGDFTYGQSFDVAGEPLEKEIALVKDFGKYDKFSFIDENGHTVGFNPKACIYAKIEIDQE